MKIIELDQAALERLVEDKLRAAHDGGRAAPNGALNPRPGEQEDEPNGEAWRGSASPMFRAQSKLKLKEAEGIMRFFRGVLNGDHTEIRSAVEGLGQRTQQVGNTIDGGVTVPYQFLTEVTIALPRVTPFADRNIVRIIPMSSETTRWTKVITKPTTPGIVSENSTYSTGGVEFGLIELIARKIGQIIPLTEEILQSNQIEMVSVIAELVAEQLGYKRNALVTRGSGTNEPEGVLTNSLISSFTWVTTDAETKADSVIGMYHSLKSQYRGDAIWLFSDQTIKYVRTLKDAQKRYLWTDGFGSNPPTLMGRPVYENSDMTTGEGLFGNFRRGYVIGQRDGLFVERNSSGDDWKKDVVNFKFRERYDGKINDENAFVKTTNIA